MLVKNTDSSIDDPLFVMMDELFKVSDSYDGSEPIIFMKKEIISYPSFSFTDSPFERNRSKG